MKNKAGICFKRWITFKKNKVMKKLLIPFAIIAYAIAIVIIAPVLAIEAYLTKNYPDDGYYS